jgi:hypothetical protein
MIAMLKTGAVVALLMSGCVLYGDEAAPVDAPVDAAVQVDAPAACEAISCPPWWPACSPALLRDAECEAACEVRVCAGATTDECRADCAAYRFDAYCP